MSEQTEITPKLPQEFRVVGDRILGEVDPRSISEEEFISSPGLLYHGAAKEFVYSPEGDFDMDDSGADGSHDYGEGFYLTDDQKQAVNYSLVRSKNKLNQLPIYSFLPFKARMLDVRAVSDVTSNGILPEEFVDKWIVYSEQYVADDRNFAHVNEFIRESWTDGVQEKIERIKTARQQDKEIIIRSRDPNRPGIFTSQDAGIASTVFRKFMSSLGYDGMIYREGGEGPNREDLTGYVFFNPKVLDTWKGWQKRK